MIKSDFDVQVKLIIMYVVGTLVVLALLAMLIFKNKRWFSKFTVPLMVVELFMLYALITVIKLS
ncbi:hypothetical protein ACYATM_02905 [Lactobacillaceae bacterium Scapto_B20]